MDDHVVAEDMDTIVDRIMRSHWAVFHLHFVDFMAAHLSDCCAVFDGDLHEMLVFTIVAQRYLRDRVAEGDSQTSTGAERRSLSASRIAAQTGMPRETVRRKLAALQARGWVERTDRAEWRMAVSNGRAAVALTLADFTRREMRRVIKLGRALKPLV
jgi:CRP-like cAMP-binding protein